LHEQFFRAGEYSINLSNVAYIIKEGGEHSYFLVQFVGINEPLRIEGKSKAGRALERQVINPTPLSDE
jgi:hypothetical protein